MQKRTSERGMDSEEVRAPGKDKTLTISLDAVQSQPLARRSVSFEMNLSDSEKANNPLQLHQRRRTLWDSLSHASAEDMLPQQSGGRSLRSSRSRTSVLGEEILLSGEQVSLEGGVPTTGSSMFNRTSFSALMSVADKDRAEKVGTKKRRFKSRRNLQNLLQKQNMQTGQYLVDGGPTADYMIKQIKGHQAAANATEANVDKTPNEMKKLTDLCRASQCGNQSPSQQPEVTPMQSVLSSGPVFSQSDGIGSLGLGTSLPSSDSDSNDESTVINTDSEPDKADVINVIPETAVSIAVREKLVRDLEEEIVDFWCTSGSVSAPASPPEIVPACRGRKNTMAPAALSQTSTSQFSLGSGTSSLLGRFRTKAIDICTCVRHIKCLSAEVEVMLLRYKLKESTALEHMWRTEDGENRQDCASTFWKLYHMDDRSNQRPLVTHTSEPQQPRVRKSMITAKGKYWKDATDAQLPDAKLLRRPIMESLDTRTASGDHALGARALPGGRSSSTRKLVQHRLCVQSQRKLEASGLSSSKSAPSLSVHLESNCAGNDDLEMDEEEDEVYRESSKGSFDLGCFWDTGSRWTRQKIHGSGVKPKRSEVNKLERLPALANAYCSQANRDNVQKSASTGILHDRLPPIVSQHQAFSKTPHHAAERKLKQTTQSGNDDSISATMRYIKVCKATGVLPTPSVLTMAQTSKIYCHSRNLTDDDLRAIASMLRSLDSLQEVDLSGHSLLSNRAFMPFLEELFGEPAMSSLKILNLSGCRGISQGAMVTLTSLLSESNGLYNLECLDLTGISISATRHLALCSAIGGHSKLKSVQLADTGFGHHSTAELGLSKVMAAQRLEKLDLAWNAFDTNVFESFGRDVAKSNTLTTLRLARCSASTMALGEANIAWFLESLAGNRSLRTLDISSNCIDFRGALVLEDALGHNKNLTELDISQNPLGVDGMRSFLRLLSRDSSGLRHFACNGCTGAVAGGSEANDLGFNATDPSARYVLDLSRACRRAVLRILYKTCERFTLAPDKAFVYLEYSSKNPSCAPAVADAKGNNKEVKKSVKKDVKKDAKKGGKSAVSPSPDPEKESAGKLPYSHPLAKNEHGVWWVPRSGFLSANFTIAEAIGRITEEGLNEEVGTCAGVSWLHHDSIVRDEVLKPIRAQYMEQYLTLVKFTPSFAKVAPLVALWQSLRDKPAERVLLLDALSRDFLLKFVHIHQFCNVRHCAIVEVLSKLLPCLMGGGAHMFLALRVPRNLRDYLSVYNNCKAMLLFNVENPTGRYHLDLENAAEYAVAEALMLLDSWQSVLTRKKGLADRSQFGTWTNIRNCYYQNRQISSVVDWHLPCYDLVRFDFASWGRPPQSVTQLPDDKWDEMFRMLLCSACRSHVKLAALRRVSSQIFLRAMQVREVLDVFPTSAGRVDALTMFLLRLCDVQNEKIIRARISKAEAHHLRQRLGVITLFPFFQPEACSFSFLLDSHEDRVAASMAISLGFREGILNVRNPVLVFADGTPFNFTTGMPMGWDKPECVPTNGTLTFSYHCSADDRKISQRRDLAKKYGGWNLEDGLHVCWWSRLEDAPSPVITFLHYCLKEFGDAHTAFEKIDGPGGNGCISLSEMKDVVLKWEWGQFTTRPELVTEVFRFLDADSGGEISYAEWGTMNQFFRELQLSMMEFLQFVDRVFGDFDLAWSQMDADGSGGIDEDEWGLAVKSIGFFGPSWVIFAYLTNETDEDRVRRGSTCRAVSHGNDIKKAKREVTQRGWQTLQKVWQNRDSFRKELTSTEG